VRVGKEEGHEPLLAFSVSVTEEDAVAARAGLGELRGPHPAACVRCRRLQTQRRGTDVLKGRT
jgi:hypothetical protein